jgi:hypothetical protein
MCKKLPVGGYEIGMRALPLVDMMEYLLYSLVYY